MFLARYTWALKSLRMVLKPAITFEFWSTLLFVVSFAPASAWVMNRLVASSGHYAVSNHDLITFFLSFRGLLFLFLGIGFALAFWFAEQVGLLIIVVDAVLGRKTSVSTALWEKITRIPSLLRLGLLHAAGYMAACIPFGGGIALTYWLLLGDKDINYFLAVKPWTWWIALILAGAIAVAYLILAVWLYTRWLLSVPALVFENMTPTGALRKSWEQTKGRFREIGLPLVALWLVVVIASLASTWLISVLAAQFLVDAGLTLKIVLPTVVGALVLIGIADLTWFIIGKTMHVMLMAGFYLDLSEVKEIPRELTPARGKISPRGVRRLGWLIAGIACFAGLGGGVAFLESLNLNRKVAVSAHRGSSLKAPENTLSALRQAIADGADYAEIDVQTTKDGVVVLMHDGDLMRIASVNRRLDEIGYEELRTIDIGSWFAPEYSSERIATLDEAIDVARGRIKLNIELKYNRPDPMLPEKVGHIIRHKGFSLECVVSSLDYQALTEISQVLPDVRTGLIVFQAVGELPRMAMDFLSINAAKAAPGLVRESHRRGKEVHVWTVNDLNNALSMLEVGADNIITDNPAGLRKLLEAWHELSDSEKIALMLRNLIMRIEPPQPSEL
jgi:glycerophosphoryl diester phosphodiesterase